MAEEIFVPLIVFTAISIIFFTAYFFNFKKRQVVFEAIKVAVEKTGTADPQLIDAIVRDNIGPNADLRRGFLLICVAVAFAILGFTISIIGGEEAFWPILGVASFPGLIGIAYIGFHFFAPREPTI